ncbi:MAG: hypothetical protein ABIF17_01060 [Patescibacteria group bacterium]
MTQNNLEIQSHKYKFEVSDGGDMIKIHINNEINRIETAFDIAKKLDPQSAIAYNDKKCREIFANDLISRKEKLRPGVCAIYFSPIEKDVLIIQNINRGSEYNQQMLEIVKKSISS